MMSLATGTSKGGVAVFVMTAQRRHVRRSVKGKKFGAGRRIHLEGLKSGDKVKVTKKGEGRSMIGFITGEVVEGERNGIVLKLSNEKFGDGKRVEVNRGEISSIKKL